MRPPVRYRAVLLCLLLSYTAGNAIGAPAIVAPSDPSGTFETILDKPWQKQGSGMSWFSARAVKASVFTALRKAVALEASGQLPEAEREYRRALAGAESARSLPSRVSVLYRLGKLLGRQARYSEAIELLRTAAGDAKAAYGEASVQAAVCNYEVVHLLITTRRYREAAPLAPQIVETFKAAFGPDHDFTVRAEYVLGALLAREDPARGQQFLEHTLSRYELSPAPSKEILGALHYNLAVVLIHFHHYPSAEQHASEALAQWTSAGINSADLGSAHLLLGVALCEQQRYAEAATRLRKARELLPRAAESTEELAKADYWLAVAIDQSGTEASAQTVTLLEEASRLQASDDTLSVKRRVDTLDFLASAYLRQNRPSDAFQTLRQRMPLDPDCERVDEGIAHTFLQVIKHLLATSDFASAEPMVEYAVRMQRKLSGEHDRRTAGLLRTQGQAYLALGQPERAVGVLRQALRIQQAVLSPMHSETISSMVMLGIGLAVQGQNKEAYELLNRAYPGYARIVTPTLWQAHAMLALAEVMSAIHKDPQRAAYLYRKARSISLDAGAPASAFECGERFVKSLRARGRYGEAESVIREMFSVDRKSRTAPESVVRLQFWKTRILQDRGLNDEARSAREQLEDECRTPTDSAVARACPQFIRDLQTDDCKSCQPTVFVPNMASEIQF